MLLACALFGLAIMRGDGVVPGLFLLLSGGGMAVLIWRRLSESAPRLVIGTDGIRTAGSPLVPWSVVTDAAVTHTKGQAYLEFGRPGGHVRFNIDFLEQDAVAIAALLAVYRERHDGARPTRR